MLANLILCCALSTQGTSLIEVPFEFQDDLISLRVSLDGRPPLRLAPSTVIRQTFTLRGVPLDNAEVAVGGKVIGRTNVKVTQARVRENVDGILGLDVLKSTALGFDLMTQQVTVWPGGDVPEAEAKRWTATYREGDAAYASVVPLGRSNGSYTVPVEWGGRKGNGLVFLALFRTTFGEKDRGPERFPIRVGSATASTEFTPEVTVAGRVSPWQPISPGPDPLWADFPAEASVTLDAFRSRRILLDFKARRLYMEQLTPDERLSMALASYLQMPFRVEGNRLFLDDAPAAAKGSEVLDLDGTPGAEIVRDLKSRERDAAVKMATLFGKVRTGYSMRLRLPDGTVQNARAKPPK